MKLTTLTLCALIGLAGCSNKPAKNLVSSESGFITISQSMTTVGKAGEANAKLSMGEGVLAFLPQANDHFKPAVNEKWISINRSQGSISLMTGSSTLEELPFDAEVTAGAFVVTSVKNNPVWYAPDSYFESRNLTVPAAGSDSRYLRGALGKTAIYLNDGSILHSARFENSEVAGTRLKDDLMEKLTSGVAKGTPVLIK